MAAHDNVVLVDASGGAIAITLPAATNGRILQIKDSTGSAATNNITVTPASGLIDGAASKVISNNYGSLELVSDGTNWFLQVAPSGGSGVTTVGTIDSQTASANGLVIAGANIYAQSASSTNPGMVNNTAQSFSGLKTFLDSLNLRDTAAAFDLKLQSTSNGVLTANRTLTLDVTNADRTIDLAGNLTVSAAATVSGTNTGDVTLAAIGSSPNANAATLTGQVLNLEPASASFGGVVTTASQTFAGDKTFNGNTLIAQTSTSQATIGAVGNETTHQINGGLQVTTKSVSANYTIV